ncbi:hypothetical protein [Novosphingobium sp. ERN07]|uniref:hypothetical protein n=1 Tax=Novosphingobium sp. ERN07 TaxID=2726187 RepID=UPI00145756BA|nr:hypothetical protein [Novosphingobium sp. ERN07]
MTPAKIAGLAISISSCLLSGSSSPPEIYETDVVNVLTLAVRAAAISGKISGDTCFRKDIEPTPIMLEERGGRWVQEFGVDYRILKSPNLGQLPEAAFAALPVAKRRSQCTHPIVFNPVQFVQLNKRGAITTHAFIDFGDRCPLCGQGYQMMAKKEAGRWIIEKPGITSTWVS